MLLGSVCNVGRKRSPVAHIYAAGINIIICLIIITSISVVFSDSPFGRSESDRIG